jgi:CelD/BcsL family acetyltransferase involved in cellulose biosynthesis
MLELRVITESSGLETLADDWERLFQSAQDPSIFSSYEWVATWWAHYGGRARLQILAAYSGSNLVGLAPLILEDHVIAGLKAFTRVKFMGTGISDRLDFLSAAGAERPVVELFANHLFRQRWDIVDLDEVAEDSATAALLPSIVGQLGARVKLLPQSVCPTIALPIHFNTYFSSTTRDLQRKIKRYRSQSTKNHGFELKIITSEGDLLPGLASFLAMYRNYFSQRAGTGHLTGEQFAVFRRELALKLARRGRLILALLRANGKDVAGQLCFRHGTICYEYNRCYDLAWKRENVGTALLWEVLRFCVAEGCRTYDFLRGLEQYKLDWGAKPRQQFRVRIYRNSAKVRLVQFGSHVSRALTRARHAAHAQTLPR